MFCVAIVFEVASRSCLPQHRLKQRVQSIDETAAGRRLTLYTHLHLVHKVAEADTSVGVGEAQRAPGAGMADSLNSSCGSY